MSQITTRIIKSLRFCWDLYVSEPNIFRSVCPYEVAHFVPRLRGRLLLYLTDHYYRKTSLKVTGHLIEFYKR